MAKRSIKSKIKSKTKSAINKSLKENLTPNQKEFIKEYNRLKRGVSRVKKTMNLDIVPEELSKILPVQPKRITKSYLKQLAKKTAKELISDYLGKNPVSDVVADVIVDTLTPEEAKNVSRETSDEYYPDITVFEMIANRIANSPDNIGVRDRRTKTWINIDYSEQKNKFLDTLRNYYDLDEAEFALSVTELKGKAPEIVSILDHIPLVSDQDDYNILVGRLEVLLNPNATLSDLADASDYSEATGV